MVKRIVWTEKALSTKKEILDYWNEKTGNKTYSRKLESGFEKVINSILIFPELGRKIENYDARVLIKGDYSIIYKLLFSQSSLEIKILQIWDTRRDPDKLKF